MIISYVLVYPSEDVLEQDANSLFNFFLFLSCNCNKCMLEL